MNHLTPLPTVSGDASRTEVLRESLRGLALAIGAGGKMPTAREIYARYDTNWITLKAALDQLEEQNIVERRLGSGIYVSPALDRKSVAIVLDSTLFRMPGASPFWGLLWSLLATEAERRTDTGAREFTFHLVQSTPQGSAPLPRHILRMIEVGTVHGLLGVGLSGAAAHWVRSRNIPMVAYAGPAEYGVTVDTAAVWDQVLGDLAASGCRRVGWWSTRTDQRDFDDQEQKAVLQRRFAEAGLAFYPEMMRPGPVRESERDAFPGTYQEQGFHAALSLFGEDRSTWPDALVVTDDMMTSGALAAFQRMGLKVGSDITVVTQANTASPTLFGYEPLLTRVEIDPAEIVRQLFSLLDLLLADKAPAPGFVRLEPRVLRAQES